MIKFKEANKSEVEQLFKEKEEFHLWPTDAKINSKGKVDIFSKVYYDEGEIDLEHSFKAEHNHTFIAKENGKIIGYAFVSIYPDRSAQWSYFSMKKTHSKKGIGKKMVTWINKELKKRKVRISNLIANVGAIDFYKNKTKYKKRNSRTARPRSFWSPPSPHVVYGWKPSSIKSKIKNLFKRRGK